MTEKEWLESADPERMLKFVGDLDDERRLLRVAVAACRRVWPLLVDERSRQAVETIDRYSHGQAADASLRAANQQAEAAFLARRQKEIAKRVGHDLAVRAMAEPKSLFSLIDHQRADMILRQVDNAPLLLAASAVWTASTLSEELTRYSRIDATICTLAQAADASEDSTAAYASQAADIRVAYRDLFRPDA